MQQIMADMEAQLNAEREAADTSAAERTHDACAVSGC